MKYIIYIALLILAMPERAMAQCSDNLEATIFHADSLAKGDYQIFPRAGASCSDISKPIIFVES